MLFVLSMARLVQIDSINKSLVKPMIQFHYQVKVQEPITVLLTLYS